jgi:tetratricopeptide (TPR) repeat protein
MRQLEGELGIDVEDPAEKPAPPDEKEEDIGRAVYKKIITDLDAKHPDQKILPLLVNGQKHIDQDEYELAIDTYSELIKVFGWENWSDEDQIIFKSANIIWSKQGNDRMFPLFWAYYFRATAKYELEEYSGCISDYSTAIDIGLNIITYDSDGESTAASARSWTILAYNGRGLAKRSKDNYQDALDDFDEALKLCQDDDVHHKKQIYYNMGLTKKDMGDDKGAADAFTSSIELSPEEINPYYYRGLSRSQIREYDGALDDFSHVIDNVKKEEHLDFDLKRTYLYRGAIRTKTDDMEGALHDYTKAIEIDPEFARAYFGRGLIKQLTGNNQGAIDDFTQAIEKGFKEPFVYEYRGEAKESMGDTEGAKEDFEKYEELKGS